MIIQIGPIDWAEFWGIILQGWTLTKLIAYTVLFMVGVGIHLTIDVQKSIKRDRTTPGKFSILYLVKDNPWRWLGILLLFAVMLIFFEDINGYPLTPFLAVAMGYNVDSIVGSMNSKTKARLKSGT